MCDMDVPSVGLLFLGFVVALVVAATIGYCIGYGHGKRDCDTDTDTVMDEPAAQLVSIPGTKHYTIGEFKVQVAFTHAGGKVVHRQSEWHPIMDDRLWLCQGSCACACASTCKQPRVKASGGACACAGARPFPRVSGVDCAGACDGW